MARQLVLAVRVLVVLAFLVGMPVLALPGVARWCEGQIYPAAAAVKQPATGDSRPQVEPQPAVAGGTQVVSEPVERYLGAAAANVNPAADPEMAVLEARLAALGAFYYRLEVADPAVPSYRLLAQFQQDGPLPRRFQQVVTGGQPQEAMRRMIALAEGRLPPVRR